MCRADPMPEAGPGGDFDDRSNHLNEGLPHGRVDAMRAPPIQTGGLL